MAKAKTVAQRKFDKAVKALLFGVRRLKDSVTGVRWTRLHRIESELGTVAGSKPVKRRKAASDKPAGRKTK